MKNKPDVIIVGAGAAGLSAALSLSKTFNVTILEANNRIGGRINTMVQEDHLIIEGGAEFIHGDLPITSRYLKEAGLKSVKVEGKMMRKEEDKWEEQQEMIEGWDLLLQKMRELKRDMTMQQFLDTHFPAEKYSELRHHAKSFVEGFDVANPDEISVQSLYHEWSHEGDQFRIVNGYGSLISFLEKKCLQNNCVIKTGEMVKEINWIKNKVNVITQAGSIYQAKKIIITVSATVLQNTDQPTSIKFSPSPADYLDAIQKIGFGTVVKVIFQFKEKLWKEGTGFIFTNEAIPTWWTQFPVNNHLLTGWAGGPVASRISHLNDDELKELSIKCLSGIFRKSHEDLRNIITRSYVFNWSTNAETLGAYSFSTPESKSARELLNKPIDNTLFFAGEALYNGEHSGTVEAALDSGAAAAGKLMASIN